MRWTDPEPKKEPAHGETRVQRRFLWKPLKLGKVTRWLEFAEIKQAFCFVVDDPDCEKGFMEVAFDCEWRDLRWATMKDCMRPWPQPWGGEGGHQPSCNPEWDKVTIGPPPQGVSGGKPPTNRFSV